MYNDALALARARETERPAKGSRREKRKAGHKGERRTSGRSRRGVKRERVEVSEANNEGEKTRKNATRKKEGKEEAGEEEEEEEVEEEEDNDD